MSKLNELYSWQQQDWQTVQALLSKQPKAILLHHLQGIAEERIVFQATKWLLCLQEKFSEKCICASCVYFTEGLLEHPDLLLVKLDKKNKGGIDIVRRVLDNELLSPHISERRVTVIQQAHYLSRAAQNGLLKSLESEHGGYYILTCTQIDGLLPTLRSRVMRHQLLLPKKEEFDNFLSGSAETKQINLLWKLTGGAPELAEEWLNKNHLEQYQLIINLMPQLFLKEKSPIVIAEECAKIEAEFIAIMLLRWWTDVITWVASRSNAQAKTALQAFFQGLEIQSLHACYQLTVEYIKGAQTSLNPTLNLENLLICFLQRCAIS